MIYDMKKTDTHIPRPRNVTHVIRILSQLYPRHPLQTVNREHQPFPSLISGILSSRTKDTTTIEVMSRLLTKYDTPAKLSALSEDEIAQLIYPVGFWRTKAVHLKQTCEILLNQHQGKVPDSFAELVKLPGVGRKIANLLMDTVFGKPYICVDTHVHRISQRLGWHTARTVEETERNLHQILKPESEWREINRILVNHGQQICHPLSPKCSACAVEKYCAKVRVIRSR